MKILLVIDMQKDFVTGVLGTPEAQSIVPRIVSKVSDVEDGRVVIFTKDTHSDNYLDTMEGKKLPVPHCIRGTDGWEIVPEIEDAWFRIVPHSDRYMSVFNGFDIIEKDTFGSSELMDFLQENKCIIEEIELVGVCTDICVIANAILCKTAIPEAIIKVDASCCAGVTPETHNNAIAAMKMLQIDIINEKI